MDEKMSEAEREFEEWCKEEYPDSVDLAIRLIPARKAYLAAAARYTERTAWRCREICQQQTQEPECPERAQYCADAIAKEFGLD